MNSNLEKENKYTSVYKSIDYYFGEHTEEIKNKIDLLLGSSFSPKYNKTGVTYFGGKGRILKIVKRRKYLEVEFNVPVTTVIGLLVLTEQERREKKMGTCQWIYKGDSLSTVLMLVEEAVGKY